MNILLIAGGWSSEREVSLAGAKIVEKKLLKLGHTVSRFDPRQSLEGLTDAAGTSDFAFINLHGSPGEDGLIQAVLEKEGCPYQGAGPAASMLSLDKAISKVLFGKAGIETPPWQLLHSLPPTGWQPEMAYPLFIKANTGGSSLHMEKVDSSQGLFPALERLFSLGSCYLLESAVIGQDVTCAVLGSLDNGREIPGALPPILIKPVGSTVFDYQSKYVPGKAEEICPAPLAPEMIERLQSIALKAHSLLGISGYSRADFILSEDGRPVLLEVNTLPGMTANSLLPKAAATAGISFGELLTRLIELGIARHGRA